MTNTAWIQNLKRTTAWLLIAATPLFVGCVKGGSISSDGSSTATTDGTITVSKVFPTSEGESWNPITVTGRFYIKGTALSITGTCTRGIAKIKVHEGVAADYAETGTCDENGYFTWSHTYASSTDIDKTLTLTPYDVADAAMTSAAKTVDTHIDDVAPTVLVVTTPATTPYIANAPTSAFNIIGTCSADTVKITFNSPTGVEVTPSGTNWNHNVTLIQGSATAYSYYAHDLAGNVSAVTTQVIDWSPTISIRSASVGSGGGVITASGGSGFKLESAITAFPGTASVAVTGLGNFNLGLGFNYITKFVREPL